jgi:aryl sulfotransferase
MERVARPGVRHVYRNHSLDSTRWNGFRPRDGDIVIASSYKSGTTWLQFIVLSLIRRNTECPPIMETSPWLESPLAPIEQIITTLEAQSHRRVIKTHLPLDGLPYHRNVSYLVVCRDARDVCMSLWNHYRHIVRYPFLAAPTHPQRIGEPLPRCPNDVRQFWRDWMTRGWFAWEREGFPFWSNLHHTQTWWECRHLPNIAFVHYNDLLDDLSGEISRVAAFLDLFVDEETMRRIADAATFANMSRRGETLLPSAGAMFDGGAATFLHKGINGRWRGVLTDDDQQLYRTAAARELSPSCIEWLEGRLGLRARFLDKRGEFDQRHVV